VVNLMAFVEDRLGLEGFVYEVVHPALFDSFYQR
jgi:hypothetical protein